jgi:DNA-binding IclR family transcriptional regulator
VVDVLEAFVPEKPSWKMQELGQHLGWDKATSHRFLTKLVDLRMLDRDDDGNFSLGPLILDLSARYMSTHPVRQRLVQVMTEVRDLTGLTTQAGYLSRGRVVIALSEEGNTMVKASAALGASLPLHATAIGKVILAQLNDDSLDGYLGGDLARFTPHTVVSSRQVRAELAGVRADGLAWAGSELEQGLDAVAVALPTSIFGVAAGLGCSGPSAAMVDRRALEAALRKVAMDVRLR